MKSNEDAALSVNTAKIDARVPVDTSLLKLLVVDNEAAHARAMTESLEKVGSRYRCKTPNAI